MHAVPLPQVNIVLEGDEPSGPGSGGLVATARRMRTGLATLGALGRGGSSGRSSATGNPESRAPPAAAAAASP
jgi:hypothetical protein